MSQFFYQAFLGCSGFFFLLVCLRFKQWNPDQESMDSEERERTENIFLTSLVCSLVFPILGLFDTMILQAHYFQLGAKQESAAYFIAASLLFPLSFCFQLPRKPVGVARIVYFVLVPVVLSLTTSLSLKESYQFILLTSLFHGLWIVGWSSLEQKLPNKRERFLSFRSGAIFSIALSLLGLMLFVSKQTLNYLQQIQLPVLFVFLLPWLLFSSLHYRALRKVPHRNESFLLPTFLAYMLPFLWLVSCLLVKTMPTASTQQQSPLWFFSQVFVFLGSYLCLQLLKSDLKTQNKVWICCKALLFFITATVSFGFLGFRLFLGGSK